MAAPLFVFEPFSTWTWAQTIGFVIGNTIALELLGWSVFLLETSDRKRISPGGKLVWQRGFIDWFYIWTNKLGTACFNYHTMQYCWNAAGNGIYWNLNEMTILNTIVALPLLFLVYDLPYSLFHRFLHARSVYGFVHKHHHKQRAPQYGNDDAINTHPIEFWIGAYLHLFAMWVVPCHMVTVLIFLGAITLMSALNHTRFEVIVGKGYIYDNREHDTHHKLLTYNYAAYTQFWDTLFGTYLEWEEPSIDYLSWPAPPTPAFSTVDACKKNYEVALSSNDAPNACFVTGSSGLVGSRLVSMLVQRGASRVVAVDLNPAPEAIKAEHKKLLGDAASKIEYVIGDITDIDSMKKLTVGIDCVFNVAAIVGPYYPFALYDKVNHQGVKVLVEACKFNKVPKMVMTSSPSTRMRGEDIYNKREDQLPDPSTFEHLQEYARTKALGEAFALKANSDDFLVCAIGPHQVYGPMDSLFLPSFIETAKNGRLRVLGDGQNLISFCHTDNCAHAHILAAKKLTSATAAPAGKYYIVTDGGAQYMWSALDKAVVSAGFPSLQDKFNLNTCFLYPVAYLALAAGKILGKPMKLNPFVVKMVSMQRYFNIDNLHKEVGYEPIRAFEEAWPETCEIILKRMGLNYKKWERKSSKKIASAADIPSIHDDGHGKKAVKA